MTRDLAVHAPLGRRHGRRDGRRLGDARGGRREPLVRRPPRPRDGDPHRGERDRAALVPSRCSPGSRPRWAGATPSAGSRWSRSCVVLPLVALLLRDRPADMGLRPYGAVEDDPPPPPAAQPVPRRVRRRAALGRRLADVLAADRQLLHLRRDHERAHRHAPDPRRDGSRDDGGRGGGPAGHDRRLRPRRHALPPAGSPTATTRASCSSGTTACAGSRCSRCRS